jgi:putative tryptophan/tyrosine transport system ATP-binding protein
MITLENIGIVFDAHTPDENRALKDINLKINKGDFITVIGSNGAGKSTLYDVIAGRKQPTSGRILLENDNGLPRNITNDPEYKRARYIGRIFQNPLLGTAGKMRLEDNMMICSKKGWKGLKISLNSKTRSYFRDQLRVLNMGLENRLNDNVNLLSGGQRQALTLLMAVMSKPALLLLDEHTAALDPANAKIVMDLTGKFAKDYGLTVMMVTHNMQHALDYGTRLLMMDAGEIILDITAGEKARLTMDDLVKRFREIKQHGIQNDQMLLQ